MKKSSGESVDFLCFKLVKHQFSAGKKLYGKNDKWSKSVRFVEECRIVLCKLIKSNIILFWQKTACGKGCGYCGKVNVFNLQCPGLPSVAKTNSPFFCTKIPLVGLRNYCVTETEIAKTNQLFFAENVGIFGHGIGKNRRGVSGAQRIFVKNSKVFFCIIQREMEILVANKTGGDHAGKSRTVRC